jgi:hypothetical protein
MVCGALVVASAVFGSRFAAGGEEGDGPSFPRIGTCYGGGLGYRSWEEGGAYWSKLRLIGF